MVTPDITEKNVLLSQVVESFDTNYVEKLFSIILTNGKTILRGIQDQRFVDIVELEINNNNDNNMSSTAGDVNGNSCINPCEYGYVTAEEDLCIPSPPGGYSDRSFLFVPCPVGTYNPLSMAVTSFSLKLFIKLLQGQAYEYLTSLLCGKMTWSNYGTYWHIDHVIPIASFDLSNEQDRVKAFHYTNLQPLEAVKNMKKGSTAPHQHQPNLMLDAPA